LSENLDRGEDLLKVLRFEFGILFNRPDISAAEEVARSFYKKAVVDAHPASRAMGHQAMGKVHFFRGEFPQARKEMIESLSYEETIRSNDLLTHYQYPVAAMVYQAFSSYCLGHFAESRAVSDKALEISRESSQFTHSLTLANILILEMMQKGSDRTDALHHELSKLAFARGAPFWVDLVGFHDGVSAAQKGDYETAVARMRRALLTFEQNSVEVEIPYYQTVLAEVLLEAKRDSEAQTLLDDARIRIDRTQERWPLAEVLRLSMVCAVHHDDQSKAQELKHDAHRVCSEQGAKTWSLRLEATAAKLGIGNPAKISTMLQSFDEPPPKFDLELAGRFAQ
ncbi:MAG: hypothetical protein AAF412_15490, partial [Pseudomonadota bacterium]